MKNYSSLLLTLFIGLSTAIHAQDKTIEPSLKYGKPSDAELQLQTYQPDTTATALVLYRTRDVFYEYISGDFRINSSYEAKIKILKSEGTSYADITIPYYYPAQPSSSLKENVIQIDATAYNWVDGKVERTRMKKEFVFKERLNDNYMQVKFSIPGVKVGSVIEYKYKILSDNYSDIKGWKAQEEIPVLHTSYRVTIPEYFSFNIDTHGFETLETKDEKANINLIAGIQCSGKDLQFTGNNLAALKEDSYVWCADDYATQVNFELNSINIPGVFFKSFTQSWQDIDQLLMKYDEFGGQLKMRNPLKEETELIKQLPFESVDEKICVLYSLLKQKISWNGKYELYGGNSKKALKEGTADNAEINFILMSMLRDAGIPSFPVVMSRRNRGTLPASHPSIKKLNTFVVAIANTDSTLVYLDGSVNDGYLNVLPPVLMVDRARIIYGPDGGGGWVDLSMLGKNQLRSIVTASIAETGKISGSRSTNYSGQFASTFRRRFREAKDSIDFVDNLANRENIEISRFETEDLNVFGPQTREVIEFEKQATIAGDYIYLNPLVFLHTSKNPMMQSDRKLPVEFAHTEYILLSINLTLPEGYQVEVMPTPLTIKTEDGKGLCRYNISLKDNNLTVQYQFNSNRLLYLPNEYPGLQTFWETIANKNNEMIVLKRL